MSRLHEAIVEDILQRVADGKLAPGEWLGSEDRIKDERGISRGVAREAIFALRERGILEVRHGRGQRVLPEEKWNLLDPQVLVAVIAAGRLDLVDEVVECRALLEPPAVALAAKRASRADIAQLGRDHETVVDAAGARRRGVPLEDPLVAAEIAFHRTVVRMTGNRPLQRMLDPVHTALAVARHELAAEEREALVRSLRRTLKALEARDVEAARKSAEAGIAQARRWLKRAAQASG
jgi:DNA-binding FadR family transcriptional regulator